MRKIAVPLAALVAAALLLAPAARAATPNTSSAILAAYYQPLVPVSTLPANELTDVIFAFGEPTKDGDTCAAPPPIFSPYFAQLRDLRAKHPSLHLLVSIGGWGAAPEYSDIALTPASRAAFASSCINEFIVKRGFEGIDIDWEFPVHGGLNKSRPQDRADATLLLREVRRQLDALGAKNHRHYFLTIATPAGTWQEGGAYSVSDSYDLKAVAGIVDWLNVMTYDMNNIFSPYATFNTPLYPDPKDPTPAKQRAADNLSGAVKFYEAHGVPASKIVLGAAFYGRGFKGVSSTNGGLYSKYTAGFDETPWVVVKSKFLTDPTWVRHWSNTAQAPWIYNTKQHIFFSYDDPQSMAIKARWIKAQHLRGVMFWVWGEDDAQDSLINALYKNI